MWLLSFIPDSFLIYVIDTIILFGAIGSFATFFALHKLLNKFPKLAPYYLLLQVVSATLLISGIYFKGGYGVEMEWREKVAELEEKLAIAEAESRQVNTVIQEKVITKTKVIQGKAKTIVTYVDRPVIQEFDRTCPIPKEVIDIHNEAAEMNLIVEKGAKK